jgi:lysozyme family protein
VAGIPNFLSIKKQYGELWLKADIKPDWRSRLEAAANKIIVNKAKYQRVEAETGVPWFMVGVIHMRESSCNFSTHLHNGDSLKARTYHVPAGRPLGGRPPFDWYFSAADALRMKGLHKIVGWTIETVLYELERYNGFGYRQYHKATLSPYLWQGTDHYGDHDSPAGKYVADGKWSPTEQDKQCGAAAVLKVLEEMGHAVFAQKVPAKEVAKDKTVGALIGVLFTTVAGFFISVGEVLGRWLELLPGHVDQTELLINTTGKVATWLNVPMTVWATGAMALAGVSVALWRAWQGARFKIPAADTDTEAA